MNVKKKLLVCLFVINVGVGLVRAGNEKTVKQGEKGLIHHQLKAWKQPPATSNGNELGPIAQCKKEAYTRCKLFGKLLYRSCWTKRFDKCYRERFFNLDHIQNRDDQDCCMEERSEIVCTVVDGGYTCFTLVYHVLVCY